jgi:hypothetical protein
MRRAEWHLAHKLLVAALNPSLGDTNYKPFSKLLNSRRSRKGKAVPLTEAEMNRWFSYESFLQLLGLASLNQEDSGGLYALHAHINHSCEPNLQVSRYNGLILMSGPQSSEDLLSAFLF